jgi:hypothetical protein
MTARRLKRRGVSVLILYRPGLMIRVLSVPRRGAGIARTISPSADNTIHSRVTFRMRVLGDVKLAFDPHRPSL